MCIDQVYQSYPVVFVEYTTLAYLVILYIKDFDIIFGIGQLSSYYVIFDLYAKTITIGTPKMERLEWEGVYKPSPLRIISSTRS